MTHLFYITLATTIFCAAAFVGSFFCGQTSRRTLKRIWEVTHRTSRFKRDTPLAKDAERRLTAAMGWLRARIRLREDVTLPERLARAGYKGILPADVYVAARIFVPLMAFVAGFFSPWNPRFCMIALPAIGWLAPNMVLTRLVKGRREKIRRSIPDTVDLLVICVDAGLGIDQALLRVGQELGTSHPQITEELLQINREQRAGKPRIQAWLDMAKRSELAEIDAFANMLLQTERFGTPVARALSSFSETIRQKRRQAAEEMAAKTTVKIIFPLVLFIFPSMFIVLLGPAVLTIVRGMVSMNQ